MRHAQRGGGGERLAPPIDVLAAGMLVRDARIDHDELGGRRPGNPLERDGARVDEQRLAGPAQAARHLVHDADRRADEVGLDPLRQAGDRVVVDRQPCCARSPRSRLTHSAALDDTPPPTGMVETIHTSKPSTSTPWPRRTCVTPWT